MGKGGSILRMKTSESVNIQVSEWCTATKDINLHFFTSWQLQADQEETLLMINTDDMSIIHVNYVLAVN